jgi:uncharacterized protein YebE (UPF0316 family)
LSDSWLLTVLLSALFVFLLLVADRTLDTLRLLFMMRGRKLLSGLAGFFQAGIFITAITQVLKHEFNAFTIVGYAGGFATGVIVGMTIDERLAMGFGHMRIISQEKGQGIAQALRQAGHAATVLSGTGKDGVVSIVNCTVRRKDVKKVEELVQGVDPGSFMTVDEVRPLARGYFRF